MRLALPGLVTVLTLWFVVSDNVLTMDCGGIDCDGEKCVLSIWASLQICLS